MSDNFARIPIEQSLTLDKALQSHGYYDIHGNWNSLLWFPEYPHNVFRGRVEVFIFNQKNEVYADILQDGVHYRIPGGSFTIGRSHKFQVAQEAKEEAGIYVGKIEYTNYSYVKFFKKKYTSNALHWDGTFNKVYIAEFKSWYNGKIPESRQDRGMYNYGCFVPFEDLVSLLTPDHKLALKVG